MVNTNGYPLLGSVGINMSKNKTSNFITIRQCHNLCFIIIIHYYITNTLQTRVSCKYILLSYKTTVNIPTVSRRHIAEIIPTKSFAFVHSLCQQVCNLLESTVKSPVAAMIHQPLLSNKKMLVQESLTIIIPSGCCYEKVLWHKISAESDER